MNYGFVIDTRSCIGCHACSTACKSENQVPLGVNRTWVRYTDSGRFPDTRRSFQVTRCNHCANPPCARICPVTAMYQRADGIVEFDSSVCIGCKACLQACPYDAIYIDPDTGTAAKCHYCGHRVEQGLEPACVVVCPTHSIIAGDMDDPQSEIARVLARNDVSVRKPEQGTAPKLFYVQGHDASLHPTALPREPAGMMYAEVLNGHGHRTTAVDYDDATRYEVHLDLGDGQGHAALRVADSGTPLRRPGPQGAPEGGPIQTGGGTMAGHMTASVAYTVAHRIPWHWQVPAYLVTKSLGTGVFLFLAVAALVGPVSTPLLVAGGAFGILATLATTGLLVGDLEHPERFLRILTRPQWKSWLTRGAFLLIGFSTLSGAWWAAEVGAAAGWLPGLGAARSVFALGTLPLAVGAAVYTAYLFAQCEGRDLWQSPLLPFHLLVQAGMMGACAVLLVDLGVPTDGLDGVARWTLLGLLALDLALLLAGELGVPHASEQAARAAKEITRGRWAGSFWAGAVVAGHVLPAFLLVVSGLDLVAAAAALLAVYGLYRYEEAFVMAPQELPNS